MVNFTGHSIAIITDTFSHNIVVKNCTLISLMTTPIYRFLEALEEKEVDLGWFNLFVLVLGYNDLELDDVFFDMYYKRVIDSLQRQSQLAKFVVSTLVMDLVLYTSAIHSKNVVIKNIRDMSPRIFLFNVWKKFQTFNMVQPKFVRSNKLTPTGATLLVKFLRHKVAGETTLH